MKHALKVDCACLSALRRGNLGGGTRRGGIALLRQCLWSSRFVILDREQEQRRQTNAERWGRRFHRATSAAFRCLRFGRRPIGWHSIFDSPFFHVTDPCRSQSSRISAKKKQIDRHFIYFYICLYWHFQLPIMTYQSACNTLPINEAFKFHWDWHF